MSDAPAPGLLSMSAGDFVDVYSRSEYAKCFDCVATCFFLDCAHNVIDLVEIIHCILKVCVELQPGQLAQDHCCLMPSKDMELLRSSFEMSFTLFPIDHQLLCSLSPDKQSESLAYLFIF